MSRRTRIIQVRPPRAAAGSPSARSDLVRLIEEASEAGPPFPFGKYTEREGRDFGLDLSDIGRDAHVRVDFEEPHFFGGQPPREGSVTFRQPSLRELRLYQSRWGPGIYTRWVLVNRLFQDLCVSSWGEPADPLLRFHYRERALNMFIDALSTGMLISDLPE